MQPIELFIDIENLIPGTRAVKQLGSNDTEVFLQLALRKDVAVKAGKPEAFLVRHESSGKIFRSPLRTKLEGCININK